MEEKYELKYHDTEQDHWWFRSRRNCILNLLRNAPRDSKILDIGCSSGVLLNDLRRLGFSVDNLYGIDISPRSIENAKKTGLIHVEVMDAQEITLNEKFDFIIASDCLEHLKDDEKALRNWYNLLSPGGRALIFVPAFMSLWSHHDVVNMHFRRYTRGELQHKMQQTGFAVTRSGFWNFFLFIPVYTMRKINNIFEISRKPSGDISELPKPVNSFLTALVNFENFLLTKVRFPFGVSTFCIAEKS